MGEPVYLNYNYGAQRGPANGNKGYPEGSYNSNKGPPEGYYNGNKGPPESYYIRISNKGSCEGHYNSNRGPSESYYPGNKGVSTGYHIRPNSKGASEDYLKAVGKSNTADFGNSHVNANGKSSATAWKSSTAGKKGHHQDHVESTISESQKNLMLDDSFEALGRLRQSAER